MPELRLVTGLEGLERRDGPVLAVVGVFDGLHRGHAWLIRRLVGLAAARAARPTVITFDHHPDEIIRGAAPPLLLDPSERIARLGNAGVETVVVVHFDDRLRRTSYAEFVASLRTRVDLAGFLMTRDSAFGHERKGTPEALSNLGREEGFEVVVVAPLVLDGSPVTSTAIRAAIELGRLRDARRLLGRSVAVTGDVEGDQRRLVTFSMPVAVPPPGTYRAVVGPPVTPTAPDGSPAVRRVVTVTAGAVGLTRPVGGGRRLRVAFRS
jgi:riboflavin kinase/FMN adenylyltransferase